MPIDIVGYDYGDLPDERVDWLWQGYLARGNMTVLAAPPYRFALRGSNNSFPSLIGWKERISWLLRPASDVGSFRS